MGNLYVDVQCPYCNRKQRAVSVEAQSNGRDLMPKVVFCDLDREGCGRYYLVGGVIDVKATVSVLPEDRIAQKIPSNGNGRPAAEVAP